VVPAPLDGCDESKITPGRYHFESKKFRGQCLDAKGEEIKDNEGRIDHFPCKDIWPLTFQVQKIPGKNCYRLEWEGDGAGKCLDLRDKQASVPAAKLDHLNCNDSTNQQWGLRRVDGDWVIIRSRRDG